MADYKDIKYNVDYGDAVGGAGGMTKIASNHQATTDGDDGTDVMDFTSGIDSTYDVYLFELNGMIPHGTDQLSIQADIGTATSYAQTNTSMVNTWYHAADDSEVGHGGHGGPTDNDTGRFKFAPPQKGSGSDDFNGRGAVGGYVYLFNPSSTVFEKHFIMKMGGTANSGGDHYTELYEGAGYFQQTAAITRIRFKYNGGSKIDGGRITMYGISK